MENKEIAAILDEIASMLSIEERPTSMFEVRAYRKAAQVIDGLQEPIEGIYAKGGLDALMELPGIGKSIAGHIEEYIKTGKIRKYEELKKKYPIDMAGLTSITGLGAKTAITLYKKLGIKDIDDLKKALAEHRISKLEGFGERSEESIKKGISIYEGSKGRLLISDALPIAEEIATQLMDSGLIEKLVIAGSTRRMKETVGDLDILAISKKGKEVMDLFTSLKMVSSVVQKGPTKSAVLLKAGLTCDIRVLEPESFGAAVQYFTGSRDHNIQVRTIAVRKGYKLNEYGLFDKNDRNIGGIDEESIYAKLGLQYIPPEMREARGEVALAIAKKIPRLVEIGDINGDLHTHTKATDGQNSIEEMVAAAQKLGYKYLANTEHTKSLYIAKGMDDKQFAVHMAKIDKLNEKLGKFKILKGVELDILKDGSLDLGAPTLKKMDCVVAAVHSSLSMKKEEMTKRVVKALDTGLVHILAHPTGRIVGEREAYEIDLEKVAEAAERNGVALEVNAQRRLDLNDTNILLVSKYKVMFAIDTDAHNTTHFQLMRYGVGTARRGWLTKDRVMNTLPIEKLLKVLKK
ncbi:MAG: DNA polymerase/3'-5' exonuclease PolX [Candidatus Marsarchaeota archaeon]|nr:DNA polymerase/3'-5' exonuclease PolX [Candidatus Marsarchaeota archaeon]